jgi:hypothetical protein
MQQEISTFSGLRLDAPDALEQAEDSSLLERVLVGICVILGSVDLLAFLAALLYAGS